MSIQEALKKGTQLLVVSSDDLISWYNEALATTRRELEENIRKENEEVYLTPKEVCKILNVHRMTLQAWKNRGYLVPAMVGGKCLYKKSTIYELLRERG